jgi:antitoxin component of RelBE/YafQ-DinJ toxin-antitoxin module
MNRVKITIRVDADLNEKFQSKLQRGGWNATRLINQMIREFVERGEAPFASSGEREKNSAQEASVLTEEIDFLNQKVEHLEKSIILLGLFVEPFLRSASR